MKKILIVGFGNMGCRHAQSLLSVKNQFSVHVVEPSLDTIKNNCERIGSNPQEITWYSDLNELNSNFDLAIIATSSAPRYFIVKALIDMGIKFFLLEKVVFQSIQQFNEIRALAMLNGVFAYCNFVNRYFEKYNDLKKELKQLQNRIRMIVYGGEFGLGCNAIHYIDIFQYITNTQKVIAKSWLVEEDSNGSRRGGEYKEFTGTISMVNEHADELFITAAKGFSGGVLVHVMLDGKTYTFSEQTQKLSVLSKNTIQCQNFEILPTSKLTSQIVADIFNENCRLTRMHETIDAHAALFEIFNTTLMGKSTETILCPIT